MVKKNKSQNRGIDKYLGKTRKQAKEYLAKDQNWKYIEIAITLFVIAFFTMFALRPAIIAISGLVGEINDKKKITNKMQGKINSIVFAQEKYALVQENSQIIDAFLPTEFQVAQGLAQVLGSTKNTGVSFDGVNLAGFQMVKKTKGAENLNWLEFNLTVSGDYDQLSRFTNNLNSSRRLLELSKYQIGQKSRKKRKEDLGGGLNLVILGRLFYWTNE